MNRYFIYDMPRLLDDLQKVIDGDVDFSLAWKPRGRSDWSGRGAQLETERLTVMKDLLTKLAQIDQQTLKPRQVSRCCVLPGVPPRRFDSSPPRAQEHTSAFQNSVNSMDPEEDIAEYVDAM